MRRTCSWLEHVRYWKTLNMIKHLLLVRHQTSNNHNLSGQLELAFLFPSHNIKRNLHQEFPRKTWCPWQWAWHIQERFLKEKILRQQKWIGISVCFCLPCRSHSYNIEPSVHPSTSPLTRSEIESGIHAEAILLLATTRKASWTQIEWFQWFGLCSAICEFSRIWVSKRLKWLGLPSKPDS